PLRHRPGGVDLGVPEQGDDGLVGPAGRQRPSPVAEERQVHGHGPFLSYARRPPVATTSPTAARRKAAVARASAVPSGPGMSWPRPTPLTGAPKLAWNPAPSSTLAPVALYSHRSTTRAHRWAAARIGRMVSAVARPSWADRAGTGHSASGHV